MITFTTFLEIFTSLVFCFALCMLSAIAAQIIYTYCQKRKNRRRRLFYCQKRQDAEQENKNRMLDKLVSRHKVLNIEKEHLLTENEALRRELRLYSEIRSDMISYSIRLEADNFDLRSELNTAYRRIDMYEREQSNSIPIDNIDHEEEYSVELQTGPDAVIQAKGISFEELEELPLIMQGTSDIPDMEAAVVIAKVDGTLLFEQFKEQIKDSKLHIGSLIDRLEERVEKPDNKQKEAEAYFYENTGFSIRDFLPSKSA